MPDSEHSSKLRAQCAALLRRAGIVVTGPELAALELADMGLGSFEREGLAVLVYINCGRYCAKELVMLPRQTCPEHRHPPVGGDPGKQETFRVRFGTVYLRVGGAPTADAIARPPRGKERWYTAAREIVLGPGEQFTIPPDTLHWFQAGPEGAVVSEFSSTSRDELDVFTDPAVRRVG
ncbi:MAG TPA: D-lyxose/D-mannose family sugar isomerase [Phycisphaerales bacterium]|nr:D-lyxose/D-mannose family sugar isomerase [Phycisphaerales bacterium]